VADQLAVVMADDAVYRRVLGFHHDGQGWFALSLFDRTLVWQVGTFGKGWVVFDGVFNALTAAKSGLDGTLYVAKGGQLYRYDPSVWSDAGASVPTRWWLPWINPAGKKRWANKYVEVLIQPGGELPLTLRRYRDYDDVNPQTFDLTAPSAPDYWDTADWDDALWDNSNGSVPVIRDHVVADSLGFALESDTVNGPLTVFGLKLYGVAEK
jgi:hypothetical protein